MRSALVLIWCLFGINAVFPLALPAEADYFAKVDDANTHPGQVVDLVSNEEQLLSKRVGRQGYYSNQGSPPVQSKWSVWFLICYFYQNETSFKVIMVGMRQMDIMTVTTRIIRTTIGEITSRSAVVNSEESGVLS